MWRKVFAILLVSSMVQAQSVQPSGSSQSNVQGPAEIHSFTQGSTANGSAVLVSSHTRYNQLRRGREEEIAVVLCHSVSRLAGCPLGAFINQAELLPLTLELNPIEGFTVRYRRGDKFRDQQWGHAVPTWIGLKVFRLKVHASDKVVPGNYNLEGKITFRKGHAGQLGAIEQTDISIPLTVVEHNAQVVEAKWTVDEPRQHHRRSKIVMALTSPIWFPAFMAVVACIGLAGDD